LILQLTEMRACEGLDDAAGWGLEGGKVLMEAVGVVVGVEGVQSIVLERIEGGVLSEKLLALLGEGELAGQEEALVIWIVAAQPAIAVFELP
jgi:hypothetical protein